MTESSSHRSSGESEEIATSTLAEIYAQQGLLGRALAIYRRMQARSPEDTDIADRIDRLERRIAEAGPEPEAATHASEGTAHVPERERLPWDPPPDDPQAGPSPDPGPVPDERPRPLDAEAFAAWLEAR